MGKKVIIFTWIIAVAIILPTSIFLARGAWYIPFVILVSAILITIISIVVSRKRKKAKKRPISIRAPKEIIPIPVDRELIFISYATVDSTLFQIPRLTKILISYPEIDEVLYWESDMHDDIYQYMDENLKLAKIILLFCSKSSLHSEAVKMEWRSALKLDKKIIPVFIEPDDIPARFLQLNWACNLMKKILIRLLKKFIK